MEINRINFKMTDMKSLLSLIILLCAMLAHGNKAHAESIEFDEEMPDIELSEEVDPFAQMLNDDLVYQVAIGPPQEVKMLLDQGAQPTASNDEGQTVMGLAAEREDEEARKVMELLIDAGADVDVRNALGDAPIHSAIKFNRPESVWLLLTRGADYHMLNEDKKSPLELAESYGNPEIIDMIKEAIRIEKEREDYKHSQKNFIFMLRNFIYFNCAQAYNSYYAQSGQDDAHELPEYQPEVFTQRQNEINEYRVKILEIFYERINYKNLDNLAGTAQQHIYDELDLMVSNRYRKKMGVGTKKDLEKRCTHIKESMELVPADQQRRR